MSTTRAAMIAFDTEETWFRDDVFANALGVERADLVDAFSQVTSAAEAAADRAEDRPADSSRPWSLRSPRRGRLGISTAP